MEKPKYQTIDDFLCANAHRFEHLGQKSETARRLLALCKGAWENDESLIVLYGLWAHEKALAAGLAVHSFFLCPPIAKWPEVAHICARYSGIAQSCYTITPRTFARISDYGDPDGILSLARLPQRTPESLVLREDSVVFVLDGLTKPGNVGVILRSCDGAGVDAVMTCRLRTRVAHPNSIKASMGAAFSLPIAPFENAQSCRDWLLQNGFAIYIADPNANLRYDQARFTGRIAVVLGNEHVGASHAWYEGAAHALSIPMNGTCDSLNVSVAAAILAYEIRSRRADM